MLLIIYNIILLFPARGCYRSTVQYSTVPSLCSSTEKVHCLGDEDCTLAFIQNIEGRDHGEAFFQLYQGGRCSLKPLLNRSRAHLVETSDSENFPQVLASLSTNSLLTLISSVLHRPCIPTTTITTSAPCVLIGPEWF